MNKSLLYLCMSLFGGIGGYLPVLFGDASLLSIWSILLSGVGAIIGVFVAKKLSE